MTAYHRLIEQASRDKIASKQWGHLEPSVAKSSIRSLYLTVLTFTSPAHLDNTPCPGFHSSIDSPCLASTRHPEDPRR